jgi:hypothetical protein
VPSCGCSVVNGYGAICTMGGGERHWTSITEAQAAESREPRPSNVRQHSRVQQNEKLRMYLRLSIGDGRKQ